jgi:hypothetical protein
MNVETEGNEAWVWHLGRIADMPKVRLYPLVVLLMTAGCAGPLGTIHSATPTSSVTSFDGSYRSTIRVTGTAAEANGTNLCDSPGQPVITVANGQFTYAVPHPNTPGNMTTSFPATMAQDGSFSGQVTDGTIAGQVRGTHMEGHINGQGCVYAFAGDRV